MARPKTLDDVKRKMVSLPAMLAQAIEDYRFSNRLKTEAEAIRRLIERGLAADDKIPVRRAGPVGGGSKPEANVTEKSSARSRKQAAPRRPRAPKATHVSPAADATNSSHSPPSNRAHVHDLNAAGSTKPLSKEAQIRALREQAAQ